MICKNVFYKKNIFPVAIKKHPTLQVTRWGLLQNYPWRSSTFIFFKNIIIQMHRQAGWCVQWKWEVYVIFMCACILHQGGSLTNISLQSQLKNTYPKYITTLTSNLVKMFSYIFCWAFSFINLYKYLFIICNIVLNWLEIQYMLIHTYKYKICTEISQQYPRVLAMF